MTTTARSLAKTLTTFLADHLEDYDAESFHVTVAGAKGSSLVDVTYHTAYDGDFDQNVDDDARFPNGQSFPLLWKLTEADVAEHLRKLEITADDAGANGTQEWDLATLLAGLAEHGTSFKQLEELVLPLNTRDNHNRRVIAMMGEGGRLAKVLDAAPNLRKLVAPSAPTKAFFEREAHPLRELAIHAGYDHESFVAELAKSRCFPELTTLTFRDYAESYMDDFDSHRVPGKHFLALLKSKTLPALEHVHLVDVGFDDADAETFRALAKKRGVRVTGEAWL